MNLLEVEGLGITFGGLHAVRDVASRCGRLELVVIGPRGRWQDHPVQHDFRHLFAGFRSRAVTMAKRSPA